MLIKYYNNEIFSVWFEYKIANIYIDMIYINFYSYYKWLRFISDVALFILFLILREIHFFEMEGNFDNRADGMNLCDRKCRAHAIFYRFQTYAKNFVFYILTVVHSKIIYTVQLWTVYRYLFLFCNHGDRDHISHIYNNIVRNNSTLKKLFFFISFITLVRTLFLILSKTSNIKDDLRNYTVVKG